MTIANRTIWCVFRMLRVIVRRHPSNIDGIAIIEHLASCASRTINKECAVENLIHSFYHIIWVMIFGGTINNVVANLKEYKWIENWNQFSRLYYHCGISFIYALNNGFDQVADAGTLAACAPIHFIYSIYEFLFFKIPVNTFHRRSVDENRSHTILHIMVRHYQNGQSGKCMCVHQFLVVE